MHTFKFHVYKFCPVKVLEGRLLKRKNKKENVVVKGGALTSQFTVGGNQSCRLTTGAKSGSIFLSIMVEMEQQQVTNLQVNL